jgi:thiol-disulfide isomerase/thioredoxin
MRKYILLALAAAAATLASCAPRGEAAQASVSAPVATSTAAMSVASAAPVSSAELRDRLIAAGLAVPKEPIAADDFELASLGGRKVKLSSYRGRVVFLNFWATWCPPCRGEMPSLERLHQQLRGRGLEIVAVDLQEPKDTVRKFVQDNSLTFTVLLDANGAVAGSWGAQSIPTTYLIDRKGSILARSVGGREWDDADMVALFETILAME